MHPSRLARVFPDHKDLIRRYGRAGINWWSEFDETQYGGGSTGLNRAWDIAREWTRLEDRWFNPMNRDVCASELWYRRWSDVIVLKSPDGRVVEFDENNPAHVFAVAKAVAPLQAKQQQDAATAHYDAIYKAHPNADSILESAEFKA